MDSVSLNQVMESGALAHVLTSQFRNAKYQDACMGVAWKDVMWDDQNVVFDEARTVSLLAFVACKQQLKLMQPPPTPLSSNTGEQGACFALRDLPRSRVERRQSI